MSYKNLLHQTCTIQTKTDNWTTTGYGTSTETWADTYENVKCRIDTISGSLPEHLRGYDPSSMYTLFLLSDQTVAIGNRVEEGSNTYLVEYIKEIEGKSALHHLEVLMRRIEV